MRSKLIRKTKKTTPTTTVMILLVKTKGNQYNDSGAFRVKPIVKEDVHKKGELPYTIEAPKSFEEFSALLENYSDDQVVEAIRRIRTYNAIAVAAENRKKMQV